jgi:hypothetical protein
MGTSCLELVKLEAGTGCNIVPDYSSLDIPANRSRESTTWNILPVYWQITACHLDPCNLPVIYQAGIFSATLAEVDVVMAEHVP